MLRFTTKEFSFLLRNTQKLPFLSQRLTNQFQFNYLFSSAKNKTQFNEKLLSGKYYEVLGFPSGASISSLTDSEVKRQYLSMVKKYHSDGVVDPKDKIQNQEITKCIISAYDKISSDRIKDQINQGIYDKIYKDEDQIAMKIYGKKFNEIKYQLFKEGNSSKRNQFMQQLQKIRKQSKYYDHVKNRQAETSQQFNQQRQSMRQPNININIGGDRSGFLKLMIPLIGVLGVVGYYFSTKKQQKSQAQQTQRNKTKLTLSQQKIKEIQKKSTEVYEKKLSDLINSYVDQQPPSLKFPTKDDPEQLEQLIEYTIGPDISLYEVDASLLSDRSSLSKLKQIKNQSDLKTQFGDHFNPFPLKKVKVNTAITLSLEAERCLQNIYVKVKDVADQIEQTGKYTPPKILFRFYGYVMFEVRDKPLSIQNYRDTQYISLFDLYFDYYSPIPVKRHQYNEYIVGLKDEDMKMYGQVHLNNRRIPERYINRQDKIVVMRDEIPDLKEQKKYIQVWQDFYKKYMSIWTRGYADRISTQHL